MFYVPTNSFKELIVVTSFCLSDCLFKGQTGSFKNDYDALASNLCVGRDVVSELEIS